MYYVLVAGNGETSRANIEALMDDFYYSKGKQEGTLVLAYEKTPTRPQVFASQYAKEKERDIVVFAYEDAQTVGIPGATFNPTGFPIRDAVEFVKGQDSVIFSIHMDGDIDSNLLIKNANEHQVPIFNLKDGLLPLNDVAVEPIPVSETNHVISAPVIDPLPQVQEKVEPLSKSDSQPEPTTQGDKLKEALRIGLEAALEYLNR